MADNALKKTMSATTWMILRMAGAAAAVANDHKAAAAVLDRFPDWHRRAWRHDPPRPDPLDE